MKLPLIIVGFTPTLFEIDAKLTKPKSIPIIRLDSKFLLLMSLVSFSPKVKIILYLL